MPKTKQDVAGASRLFAFLLLLLGLLAMHGLASSHRHDGETASSAVVAATAPVTGVTAHHHAMSAADHDVTNVLTARFPDCGSGCSSAATALCLAVLLAGAATIRERQPWATVAPQTDRAPRVRSTRRPLLPPPDPVCELCVSRT